MLNISFVWCHIHYTLLRITVLFSVECYFLMLKNMFNMKQDFAVVFTICIFLWTRHCKQVLKKQVLAARHHLSVVIFFWPFGINGSNASSIENWIPLTPLKRGSEWSCTFHYLSWTDSIKPSLQFSFLYFGFFALEWSTFTRISMFVFLCIHFK